MEVWKYEKSPFSNCSTTSRFFKEMYNFYLHISDKISLCKVSMLLRTPRISEEWCIKRLSKRSSLNFWNKVWQSRKVKGEYYHFTKSTIRNWLFQFIQKVWATLKLILVHYVPLKECTSLWAVCFVYTLSHGQAAMEWAFTINKDYLIKKLHEESVLALNDQ